MAPGAIYVAVGGPNSTMGFMTRMFRMMLISLFGRHKMASMLAKQTPEDLNVLREFLESGGRYSGDRQAL